MVDYLSEGLWPGPPCLLRRSFQAVYLQHANNSVRLGSKQPASTIFKHKELGERGWSLPFPPKKTNLALRLRFFEFTACFLSCQTFQRGNTYRSNIAAPFPLNPPHTHAHTYSFLLQGVLHHTCPGIPVLWYSICRQVFLFTNPRPPYVSRTRAPRSYHIISYRIISYRGKCRFQPLPCAIRPFWNLPPPYPLSIYVSL